MKYVQNIKRIMGDNMKNRGFTLVELLGVMALITLILLIAFPLITDSIRNHEGELNEMEAYIIEQSTKLFLDDYSDEYVKEKGAIYCIPLTTLRDKGYLKDVNSSNIINEKTVKVIVKKDFDYDIVDNDKCSENIP